MVAQGKILKAQNEHQANQKYMGFQAAIYSKQTNFTAV